MSKEERQKRRMRRQAGRRWRAVGRELRDLEYEYYRLSNIYFDDDDMKEKIRAEYMDKMIELNIKRNSSKIEWKMEVWDNE